jgi:hypothetical protein
MPNRPQFNKNQNKKFCSHPSTSQSNRKILIIILLLFNLTLLNKEETTNENSSDLPGFYYDSIKQRYFKIQSNTFGVQSVVTNESIRLMSKAKNDLTSNKSTSINLIDNLIKIQFGKFDRNLINDLEIVYMKQLPLVQLENSVQIKKINTFKLNTNDKQIYFLINISGYLNNLVQCISINSLSFKRNLSNLDYLPIRFNHLNDSNEFYGTSQTLRSSGLAYIQNNNYLVTDHYPSEGNINKKQKLSISFIDFYNRDQLNEKIIFVKNFTLPLWCSSLNSNIEQDNQLNKCVIGFPKNAIMVNFHDNRNEQILDSFSSDVYCAKFKSSDFENQVFIGCKNKFLFGHDLRLNTKESAPIKLEHNSCLNDILFDNVNLNQLYTSDLTGQVNLTNIYPNY